MRSDNLDNGVFLNTSEEAKETKVPVNMLAERQNPYHHIWQSDQLCFCAMIIFKSYIRTGDCSETKVYEPILGMRCPWDQE